MKKGKLIELEPNQWHKHNFIRTFFRINLEALIATYRKINGSMELNTENWAHYVNSKELFNLVYPLMSRISDFTREAIAYSEPIEWLGNEMRTSTFEVFHAIPMALHDKMTMPDLKLGTLQHATRCFITMLNHMFFKHLCEMPFMILRETKETGSMWVYLNENLEYAFMDKNFYSRIKKPK